MPSFFAKVSDLRSGAVLPGAGFSGQAAFERRLEGRAGDIDPVIAMADEVDHPLWWSVNDEGGIDTVAVPVRGRVEEIADLDGGYEVTLAPSQLPRILEADAPGAADLLARLRRALESRTTVLVAETDDHRILAVEETDESIGQEGGTEAGGPFDGGRFLESEAPAGRPLPLERVIELFKKLAAHDCGPRPSGTTCIPFMYPDDGCWGRAHEMYRLLLQEDVNAEKGWIYGSLVCPTRNNPDCKVSWRYHVAPKLPVQGMEEHILDPSIFAAPVPTSRWVAHQGGAMANLRGSFGNVFYRPPDGVNPLYDPDFSQTKRVLDTYRLALVRRGNTIGPPPYNCP